MKIGIAGPIQTAPLVEFLDDVDLDKTSEGLGGIPVTQLVKGLLNTDHEVSVYSFDQNINRREILRGKKPNGVLWTLPTKAQNLEFF